MSDVVEQLEKLTGPDREADYALAELVMAPSLRGYRRLDGDHGWYSDAPAIQGANKLAPASRYTDNIDDALDLFERRDQANYWRIEKLPPSGIAAFGAPFWATWGPAGEQEQAVGATAAIALCIAALKTLAESRPK